MGVDTERFGGTLGRLREQRESIRSEETLDLRVPGYDDLQVRYKLMSEKATEEVAKKIEAAQRSGSGRKNLDAVADFLIAACDSVLVRDGDGFECLVDDSGVPVRFDATLAEALGFESETARDIVLETFSPKGDDGLRRHPDSMIDQFMAIASWRRGRAYEIDRDLLGN